MVVCPKIMIQFATAWDPVICVEDMKGNDLIEFSKNFTALRKSFSCGVCNQLMTNRIPLVPTTCKEHFVCSECRGGTRQDGDKCSKCEDWSVFEENDALNIMLQSYQKFCYSLLTSERFTRLLEVKHEVDPKFDSIGLIDLLGEGMKGCKVQMKSKRALNNTPGVVPMTLPRRKKPVANREYISSVRSRLENPEDSDHISVEFEVINSDGDVADDDDDVDDADDEVRAVITSAKKVQTKARNQKPRSKVSNDIMQSDSQLQKDSKVLDPGPVLPSSSITPASGSWKTTTSSNSSRSSTPSQTRKSRSVDEDDTSILPDKNSREGTPSQSPSPSVSGSPTKAPISTSIPPHPIPLFARAPGGKLVLLESPPKVVQGSTVPGPSAAPHANLPAVRMMTSSGAPVAKNITLSSLPPNFLSMIRSNSGSVIQVSNTGLFKALPLSPQIRFAGANTVQLPGGQILQVIGPSQTSTLPSSTTNSSQTSNNPSFCTAANSSPASNSPSIASTVASGGPPVPPPAPTKRRVFVPTSMTLADFRGKWPDPTSAHLRGTESSTGYGQNLTKSVPCAPGTVNIRPPRPTAPGLGPVVVATTSTSAISSSSSQINQSQNVPPTVLSTSANPATYASRQYAIPNLGPSNVSQSNPGQPIMIDASTLGQTLNTEQNLASAGPSTIIAQGANLGVGGVMYTNQKKSDCKCGSGTATPGNLTCIGQRCVCYANRNACLDCKCKGCKNPYIPGTAAKKMLHQNVRTVPMSESPNQSSQGIQFVAAPVPLGSSNATTTIFSGSQGIPNSNPPMMANIGGGVVPNNFATMGNDGSSMQQQPPTSTAYYVNMPMNMNPLRINPSTGSGPQIFQIGGSQGIPILVQQTSGGPILQAPPNTGYTIQGLPLSQSSIAGNYPASGFPVAHIQTQRTGLPQPQVLTLQQPQVQMDMANPPQENRRQ